jgi:hypothetical protein
MYEKEVNKRGISRIKEGDEGCESGVSSPAKYKA